jgi:transcriptional regulator with XRE-family HTH domain
MSRGMFPMGSLKNMPDNEVGNRVRRYRESQGLTQKNLADMMNVSRGYLAGIERGNKEPSFHFLKKLLEATRISSEWIFRGVGPMLVDTVPPEEGKQLDADFLMDAGLEKLECGLFGIGDKVYVPMSNIEACCGSGFDVFEDYSIGEAVAVSKRETGTLRGDMLPFAVRTEGRSMEGYGIKEGSTVIVNPAEDIYSGCVALVIYGEKASVKKIYDTPDGKDLVASNGQKFHVTHEELSEDWGPSIRGRVMVVISPPEDGI